MYLASPILLGEYYLYNKCIIGYTGFFFNSPTFFWLTSDINRPRASDVLIPMPITIPITISIIYQHRLGHGPGAKAQSNPYIIGAKYILGIGIGILLLLVLPVRVGICMSHSLVCCLATQLGGCRSHHGLSPLAHRHGKILYMLFVSIKFEIYYLFDNILISK